MQKNQLCFAFGICGVLVACGGDDSAHKPTTHTDGGDVTAHLDGGTNTLMDSGLGGSSDVRGVCRGVCAGAVAAQCPNDDNSTCESDCVASVASLPSECRTQASIAFTCASTATFSCDSDGESEPVGCDDQFNALDVCLGGSPALPDGGGLLADGGASDICAAEADDDQCDQCAKSKCCDALSACGNACGSLADCVTNCDQNDQACQNTCAQQSTAAAVKQLNAVLDCYGDTCADSCSP